MRSADGGNREPDGTLDAEVRRAAASEARRGSCPGDDRLLDFYRGALDPAGEEDIREHLASCPGCVARARDASDFAATVIADRAAAEPAHARAWWIGLAAAAAIVLIAGLWVVRRSAGPDSREAGTPGTPARLASGDITIAPAPYPVPGAPPGGDQGLAYRDGSESGDPFVLAMERYVAADFAATEIGLEAVVAAQPADVRARFYLGVIRLLNGRTADALRDLQIVERSGAVPQGLEVGWYLTLALLKSGRTGEARDRLDAIVAAGGPRAGEARAILDHLDHETGR